MPFPQFDRSRLEIKPLAERVHDMTLDEVLSLDAELAAFNHPDLPTIAERIVAARRANRPVILMMGAHVIKTGLSRFLIEWLRRGVITNTP